MDEELKKELERILNGQKKELESRLNESPIENLLLDFLEADLDEIVIVGKKGESIYLNYDYQNEVTALGLLDIARKDILDQLDMKN